METTGSGCPYGRCGLEPGGPGVCLCKFYIPVPEWPGLHPGTGTNDHIHSYENYRAMMDGNEVIIRACTFCGALHPTDMGFPDA